VNEILRVCNDVVHYVPIFMASHCRSYFIPWYSFVKGEGGDLILWNPPVLSMKGIMTIKSDGNYYCMTSDINPSRCTNLYKIHT
jgi:hypothetical protein